jgi:hypothetical protein
MPTRAQSFPLSFTFSFTSVNGREHEGKRERERVLAARLHGEIFHGRTDRER